MSGVLERDEPGLCLDVLVNNVGIAEPDPRLPFLIVADDLTGACDSAAGFLRAGEPVTVALQDAVVEEVDGVVAIDTDTRGLDESAARRRLEQLVARLPAGQPVFKKIDSLLRGHVATELAVLRDWFPDRLVVVAPAFPANGRTTRRGVQHLHGRPLLHYGRDLGDGAASSDVLARVLEPHRSRRVTPERLDRTLVGVVTCDAETDEDLDRIVAALDRRVADVIWVGSGGLSAALARSLGGAPTVAAWEPRRGSSRWSAAPRTWPSARPGRSRGTPSWPPPTPSAASSTTARC